MVAIGGKFVPRQRKRKQLDRQRSRSKGTQDPEDTNVLEIAPGQETTTDAEKKKTELREELRPAGVKVSSKKAKRLEKYIDTKLKKDENRELLAKLAANKIDTSLFSSTKSLGQTRLTKKEELSRLVKEAKAGLITEKEAAKKLYEKREVKEGAPVPKPKPTVDEDSEGSEDEQDSAAEKPKSAPAETSEPTPVQATTTSTSLPVPVGAGLKRPLEVDESGRPILAKRQKRGGVKTKHNFTSSQAPAVIPVPEVVEWDGFSSEGEEGSDDEESEGSGSGGEEEGSEEEEEGEEEEESGEEDGSEEDEEGSEDESEDDDSAEESDEDMEDAEEDKKAKSSAFKAWAHQARNEALGYKPAESSILEIPKPANFTPRPIEQEPLPIELQPTKNDSRKAFAVVVTRTPEIQETRFRLPVVAEEQKIMEAIHDNDIVIICGATGSGKTTQVPQFLFESGYGVPDGPTPGMIGVTQPRRVAAVSMSKRVGEEMGDYSHVVSYQIRFEGTVDSKTAIKFMTDGVLLREAAIDIALRKYSAIIIDEAHERSVNTDILIAMLSRVVKLRRELAEEDPTIKPLKLIIMSATLRVEEFTQNSNLFHTTPRIIEVEGREHAVTMHFAKKTNHDYVDEAFRKICRGHRKLPPGGMLVFMTGQSEIAQLSKRLKARFGGGMNTASTTKVRISAKEAPMEVEDIDFGDVEDDRNINDRDDDDISIASDEEDDKEFEIEDQESGTGPLKMHILPLFSLLPTKEQMKVFEPPPEGHRLVILATNVAETSLTIPGIKYVFDTGRSKERKYDPVSGVQSFEIGWISKASAKQRAGRAGRTGPGHCWRLYSSAVYERDFPEFSEPELLRMPIEGVVLQLKSMNLQHVVNFPFPTPPPRESLIKAEKLLTYLNAISQTGQVTPIGSTMSIFPLSPRFARILLIGHLHDCLPYTVALVAGLSAGEIYIPENQAIPAAAVQEAKKNDVGGSDDEDDSRAVTFRTTEDVLADDRRAKIRAAFNAVHKNFCYLDDKSDAIKLLQVVGEFAHDPTESWCDSHFVRFKVLKEIKQLQKQLIDLLRTNIPAFANLSVPDTLDPPSQKQVQALKQMVAAGFIDQVAIRADKAPTPPEMYRKPKRAIDVPYLPLIPLEGEDGRKLELEEKLVYIHPSSPLAHLSVDECPDYIVYAYLQKAGNTGADGQKRAKTRMHALTDLTAGQLASLAKGTPLITYGKPIKEVKGSESKDGKEREVWVVPYLRAEGQGGMGWPLPARKVKQRKVAGQGWVVE
ncbi:P-loop containing nucleoside triphosphate hydrolase protein [Neurospora hispaniola]|uniref:RNA helicase n=1 Tax=Neurospora hispaniola TaxID=588809 RepID=A0AAJ0IFC8_9PEZI|nr:P-loop containing nucleoside triphosphate hydrolase protein [Neurospora hispaniola]